jgi:hypothetical protein
LPAPDGVSKGVQGKMADSVRRSRHLVKRRDS